jgi:hypothetical protein
VDGRNKSGHDELFSIDGNSSTFAARTATDIHDAKRYINPARHVRAFGVAWESDK